MRLLGLGSSLSLQPETIKSPINIPGYNDVCSRVKHSLTPSRLVGSKELVPLSLPKQNLRDSIGVQGELFKTGLATPPP